MSTPTAQAAAVDKATPRPWRVGSAMDEGYALVILAGEPRQENEDLDRIICAFTFVKPHEEVDANAELIVRSVNQAAGMAAVIEALALCAIPYEALLMDRESRKWIAPEVWSDIERAVIAARAALAAVEGLRKGND